MPSRDIIAIRHVKHSNKLCGELYTTAMFPKLFSWRTRFDFEK